MSAYVVTSRVPVVRHGLEPHAPYISQPTMIANFTTECLSSRWSIATAPKSLGEG